MWLVIRTFTTHSDSYLDYEYVCIHLTGPFLAHLRSVHAGIGDLFARLPHLNHLVFHYDDAYWVSQTTLTEESPILLDQLKQQAYLLCDTLPFNPEDELQPMRDHTYGLDAQWLWWIGSPKYDAVTLESNLVPITDLVNDRLLLLTSVRQ